MFLAVLSGRVWYAGGDNSPQVRHSSFERSLYEDWTEDRPLMRNCIREGSVASGDLRDFPSDVIELRPSIRPYIRCTGHPHFKSTIDRVSFLFLCVASVLGFGFYVVFG